MKLARAITEHRAVVAEVAIAKVEYELADGASAAVRSLVPILGSDVIQISQQGMPMIPAKAMLFENVIEKCGEFVNR